MIEIYMFSNRYSCLTDAKSEKAEHRIYVAESNEELRSAINITKNVLTAIGMEGEHVISYPTEDGEHRLKV